MALPGPIFWIWSFAILACAVFVAWYFNWRGALTPPDVERYMAQIESNSSMSNDQQAIIRAFLSDDDSKEFVMLNVIKFHDGRQPHPTTGEPTAPVKLMREYQKQFLGNLFKSAGHPLYVSRKNGGYIDTFGLAETPEYSIASMVRYRSRRDFADAIVNTVFSGAHPYKAAAIEHTFNFPTQMNRIGVWEPGRIVPLVLVLLAALAHNTVLSFRG